MKEMKIKYNTISISRQLLRDRLQLISASIGIVVGFWETIKIYKGVFLIIPILGFAMALINIVIAKFYIKFMYKYGDKLELILIRMNGMMMLITGLGFHILGSKDIQYAYYLLSFLYFIIFPYFLLPAKNKKLIFHITLTGIVINRLFLKVIQYPWQEIESISLKNEVLQLKIKNRGKMKKYFIQKDDLSQHSEIIDFIKKIKSKNKYSFEIGVN